MTAMRKRGTTKTYFSKPGQRKCDDKANHHISKGYSVTSHIAVVGHSVGRSIFLKYGYIWVTFICMNVCDRRDSDTIADKTNVVDHCSTFLPKINL